MRRRKKALAQEFLTPSTETRFYLEMAREWNMTRREFEERFTPHEIAQFSTLYEVEDFERRQAQ